MPVIILLLIGFFYLGCAIKNATEPRGRIFTDEEHKELIGRCIGKNQKECRKIYNEINNRR